MSLLNPAFEEEPIISVATPIIEVVPPQEVASFRDQNPVSKFGFDPLDGLSLEAGRLHARVYLKEDNGYVTPEDIDERGLLTEEADPYTSASTYFYASDEEISVVARQISVPSKQGSRQERKQIKEQGIGYLPTLKEFSCDTDVITATAGVEQLSDLKDSEVVEISGLASEGDGTHWSVVRVYSEMMRTSMEEGHKLWVMSTDSRLTPMLDFILLDNLKEMGESKEYMGSVSDPRCMNPTEVLRSYLNLSEDELKDNDFIAKTRDIFFGSLEGMNVDRLPDDIVEGLIEAGVNIEKSGKLRGMFKKHKASIVAGSILTAYAGARAIPLAGIDEFSGSPAIFAAIDIGTVPPYTAGLEALYSRKSRLARKIGGGVLASASFIAPYAYLYAEGEEYPSYVNGFVAGMIAVGVAADVIPKRLARKRSEQLDKSISS